MMMNNKIHPSTSPCRNGAAAAAAAATTATTTTPAALNTPTSTTTGACRAPPVAVANGANNGHGGGCRSRARRNLMADFRNMSGKSIAAGDVGAAVAVDDTPTTPKRRAALGAAPTSPAEAAMHFQHWLISLAEQYDERERAMQADDDDKATTVQALFPAYVATGSMWHACVAVGAGAPIYRAALARMLLLSRQGTLPRVAMPAAVRTLSAAAFAVTTHDAKGRTPLEVLACAWPFLCRSERRQWRSIGACLLAHPDQDRTVRIVSLRKLTARRRFEFAAATSSTAAAKDDVNDDDDRLNVFEWLLWEREWTLFLTLWLLYRHNVYAMPFKMSGSSGAVGSGAGDDGVTDVSTAPFVGAFWSSSREQLGDDDDDDGGGDIAFLGGRFLFGTLLKTHRKATGKRLATLLYYAASAGGMPFSGVNRLAFSSLCRAAAQMPGNLLCDALDMDAAAATTTANDGVPSPSSAAASSSRFQLVRALLMCGRLDCVRVLQAEFAARGQAVEFASRVRVALERVPATQMIRDCGAFASVESARFLFKHAPSVYAPTHNMVGAQSLFRAFVALGAHRDVVAAFLDCYDVGDAQTLLGTGVTDGGNGNSLCNTLLAALLALECPNTDTSVYLLERVRSVVPIDVQRSLLETGVVRDPLSFEIVGRLKNFESRDIGLRRAVSDYRQWLGASCEQPDNHTVDVMSDVAANVAADTVVSPTSTTQSTQHTKMCGSVRARTTFEKERDANNNNDDDDDGVCVHAGKRQRMSTDISSASTTLTQRS